MKYSSKFLKLQFLSACLCSGERANENDFAASWDWPLAGRQSDSRTWCHQVLWKLFNKGLMISFLLPSVLLNSLWMEIYSKSDLSMPDGLKLTLLSSHLPGSHSLEALVCIRQKAHCPLKKGQWASLPSQTRPSDCCHGGDGNSFLE